MKSSRSRLRETQDKRPLDRDPGQELVSPPHYEYDKAFFFAALGSMGISNSIGHGEKFSAKPTTGGTRTIGTRGRWIGTWTGVGFTVTLVLSFFDRSPWIHGLSGSTLVCYRRRPLTHGLRPKKLYTSL